MIKKIIESKILGVSVIEALVSTAIIGIGFVAILQMTNFSVQSIDSSGERTKANFLTTMIVEDIIGNRNTYHGKKADDVKTFIGISDIKFSGNVIIDILNYLNVL